MLLPSETVLTATVQIQEMEVPEQLKLVDCSLTQLSPRESSTNGLTTVSIMTLMVLLPEREKIPGLPAIKFTMIIQNANAFKMFMMDLCATTLLKSEDLLSMVSNHGTTSEVRD